MNNIKLSIIMPCYNVADTISRAIDSILMQDVNFDYEIIIVNDASTDSTNKILAEYTKKYKQLKVIENENNLGNARTFKKGVDVSRGSIFVYLMVTTSIPLGISFKSRSTSSTEIKMKDMRL